MRWAVIAGVLGAVLPTVALAQVKVVLGDGVAVVFPGAPTKMHTTVEAPAGAEARPAPRAPGGPPMPVAPVPHDFKDLAGADNWILRKDHATFTAIALSLRGSHPDLPARCLPIMNRSTSGVVRSCRVLGSGPNAVREDRRVFADGNLMISRSISRGGRAYMVTYMQTPANPNAKETTGSGAGDDFLASLSVSGPGSK